MFDCCCHKPFTRRFGSQQFFSLSRFTNYGEKKIEQKLNDSLIKQSKVEKNHDDDDHQVGETCLAIIACLMLSCAVPRLVGSKTMERLNVTVSELS